METVINKNILGNGLNKWQFAVPIEKGQDGKGSVIGKINLENTKTRELFENIEELIDFCLGVLIVPDEQAKSVHLRTILHV